METLLDFVRSLDGILDLAPDENTDFPEIAWGDHFFYFSPSGEIPGNTQPFATIVTKDYPGDAASDLDAPGRWRLNIHIDRATHSELFADGTPETDSTPDVFTPHPLYGKSYWVSVINPDTTLETAMLLLKQAYERARIAGVPSST